MNMTAINQLKMPCVREQRKWETSNVARPKMPKTRSKIVSPNGIPISAKMMVHATSR